MKKMLAVLVAGFAVAPALASNVNITVKSGASSSVTVNGGATVNFTVEGVLSDSLNEGLALIGFDLRLTGSGGVGQTPLPANVIVTPTTNPMKAFVKPDGITNPAGFGGTLIGGDLVQVGGGQNTIKNSVDNPSCAPNCAAFPVGTPILGVGLPPLPQTGGTVVIASGSFTAPASGGPYTLQVLNGFANVIKDGEVLGNAFLATEAAGVNVIANLTVNIQSVGNCGPITASTPTKCSVDARRPYPPGQTNVPANWQTANSIVLTMNNCGAAVAGDFTVACQGGGAEPCPTISTVQGAASSVTVNFSTRIPPGKWTCVTHTTSGSSACIGSLPGDTSGNLTTAPADIIDLIDHLNGIRVPLLAVDHCDMDRSTLCAPADIISLIDMLNGTNGYIVWNGKNIPACPSP